MDDLLYTAPTEPAGLVGPGGRNPAFSSDLASADLAYPDLVGKVLADRYVVEGVLAMGGMGIVYAARHVQLAQPVAIKLLRPELLGNEACVSRFLQEARAAAALRSEHVVRIMDVGRLETGVPYMVMERLEGTDLSSLLERHGNVSPEVAVDYVLQACAALSEAHAAGIVHRDIKPENLVLADTSGRRTGLIKVVDFGVAKRIAVPPARALTGPEESLGSPSYMSPEQISASRNVDGRADVWALGVVLYELVTGRVPFEGESILEIHSRALKLAPPRMATSDGAIDTALERIVWRCLAKNPQERYATVDALSLDLSCWRSTRASTTEGVDRDPPSLGGPHTMSLYPRITRRSRAHHFLASLVLLTTILVVCGVDERDARAFVAGLPQRDAVQHTGRALAWAEARGRELLDEQGIVPRLNVAAAPRLVRPTVAYLVEPLGVLPGTDDSCACAERELDVVDIELP